MIGCYTNQSLLSHLHTDCTVYNFDIFNDAMLEIPSQLDDNISSKDREEGDTILEYLKSQNVLEDTDKTEQFQMDGTPIWFPVLSKQELDKVVSKRIVTATKWQTKWAVNVFIGF